MARLGFSAEESSIEEIKEIAELPNLVLEGVLPISLKRTKKIRRLQ